MCDCAPMRAGDSAGFLAPLRAAPWVPDRCSPVHATMLEVALTCNAEAFDDHVVTDKRRKDCAHSARGLADHAEI